MVKVEIIIEGESTNFLATVKVNDKVVYTEDIIEYYDQAVSECIRQAWNAIVVA